MDDMFHDRRCPSLPLFHSAYFASLSGDVLYRVSWPSLVLFSTVVDIVLYRVDSAIMGLSKDGTIMSIDGFGQRAVAVSMMASVIGLASSAWLYCVYYPQDGDTFRVRPTPCLASWLFLHACTESSVGCTQYLCHLLYSSSGTCAMRRSNDHSIHYVCASHRGEYVPGDRNAPRRSPRPPHRIKLVHIPILFHSICIVFRQKEDTVRLSACPSIYSRGCIRRLERVLRDRSLFIMMLIQFLHVAPCRFVLLILY